MLEVLYVLDSILIFPHSRILELCLLVLSRSGDSAQQVFALERRLVPQAHPLERFEHWMVAGVVQCALRALRRKRTLCRNRRSRLLRDLLELFGGNHAPDQT